MTLGVVKLMRPAAAPRTEKPARTNTTVRAPSPSAILPTRTPVPRERASTHKRSLSLPTPRTSTRNPFMFHRAYGARGSHGQLAKPGEKHREGKPSTETRRGRPHLDVSTHDRARGGDRIG